MKRTNLIFNISFIFGSVYLFFVTYTFPTRFGVEDSGPALFPRFALIALVVLLVLDSIMILKNNSDKPIFDQNEKKKLKSLVLFNIIIFLFIFLLGKVNFIFLSIVCLFILCKILKINWKSSIITSSVLSLFIYFVFVEGLNIIL
ncbi:tripartite tricarboxylate transporter TctB family protein [Alkalicoccobacillus porphyridii]|uniref:DUF1468 domain-containing protein n=1 Tax=Alkalicoccobacillus porphyridii TaxID=2597270 RepID=A0A554A419_9BACI|nr:tripartite tricarboxylate transporter TctB family protein [Alkalicoccobacillus porphyridii]TSB48431.1 hypothetical protein FN960_02430 [Alkalicoccobacillus porphyridii]